MSLAEPCAPKQMNKNRKLANALSLFFLSFFLSILLATAARAATRNYIIYVGTYTEGDGHGKGIYAYGYDANTGKTTSLGLAAVTTNPSWVALSPSGRFLYAANEVGNYEGSKSGGISSFAVDAATGKLTFLNEVASRGAGPCYLSVDHTGKYVLVANYDGGSVAAFPILPDGKLGPASAFVQHTGHGTNPERQEAPHAHSIVLSPDNRFAIVNDLGLDELLVYKFDSTKGALTPNDPPFAKLDPGVGPRHFALAPDHKFAYVINEMGRSVTALSANLHTGVFDPIESVSTLPTGFSGRNDDAEIEVHPSGRFLYASNRGEDSIAVFAIDSANGKLKKIEDVPTGGKEPRSFAIDPTGRLLFVANQNSDDIVIFRINASTGQLIPTGEKLDVPSPVCIKFLAVK
jgi:6-phosphogluconolactonase